jgi:hypothetical protein
MNEQTHIDPTNTDQHILDLLNGSIDGELNVPEQTELDTLLDGSERIRDLNSELINLAGMLDDVPKREPPGYLLDAITSQVRLPVPANGQQKAGLFSQWLSSTWMRTGLAMAAGVLLTVGIYQSDSGGLSPEDAANMTGTIVKHPSAVLAGSTRFDTDVMSGEAQLFYRDNLLYVEVRLESDGESVLNLDFSGQGLAYAGIKGVHNQADVVEVVKNSIVITSTGGEQQYELLLKPTEEFLHNDSTKLMVGFFADNVLIHQAELGGSR